LLSEKYNQNEAEVTLGLLKAIHEDQSLTQRSASQDLGIALGLVNTYLKRCVKKGLIKIKQVPSSRYAYYLTPKGFAEKSKLTASYLSQSMSFFRLVRTESANLLQFCAERGWKRVVLVGKSELCEITILGASDHNINLVGIVDAEASKTTGTFMGIRVYESFDQLEAIDAVLITDMKTPQEAYDALVNTIPPDRMLTMPFLGIYHENVSALKDDLAS